MSSAARAERRALPSGSWAGIAADASPPLRQGSNPRGNATPTVDERLTGRIGVRRSAGGRWILRRAKLRQPHFDPPDNSDEDEDDNDDVDLVRILLHGGPMLAQLHAAKEEEGVPRGRADEGDGQE